MKAHRALLVALLTLASVSAFAQWQWMDRDGRKVFSDRAPPPDVPEKNILKRPGKAQQPPAQDAAAIADPASTATAPVAAPAGALPVPKKSELDVKLEEKKKQAEQAEAAK